MKQLIAPLLWIAVCCVIVGAAAWAGGAWAALAAGAPAGVAWWLLGSATPKKDKPSRAVYPHNQ